MSSSLQTHIHKHALKHIRPILEPVHLHPSPLAPSFTICFNFKCVDVETTHLTTQRPQKWAGPMADVRVVLAGTVWVPLAGCAFQFQFEFHFERALKNYHRECFSAAVECEKVGPALKQCQRQRRLHCAKGI